MTIPLREVRQSWNALDELMLAGLAGHVTIGSRLELVELRQYTITPGCVPAFLRLFQQRLIAPQEAAGMRILAVFTIPSEPDKVVWLRHFASPAARLRGLSEFYFGPVWRQHRDEANAMIIDSDDVHLLRPVSGRPTIDDVVRSSPGAQAAGRFALTITPGAGLARPPVDHGAADLETAPVANDFPQLPVHGHVVTVRLARLRDADRSDPDRAAHDLPRGAVLLRGAPPG